MTTEQLMEKGKQHFNNLLKLNQEGYKETIEYYEEKQALEEIREKLKNVGITM